MISDLNRAYVSPERAPSSKEFVERYITKPELMSPIILSHKKNAAALKNVRAAIAAGKLTPDKRKEADRQLIRGFLPSRTPNGILLDQAVRERLRPSTVTKLSPKDSESAI